MTNSAAGPAAGPTTLLFQAPPTLPQDDTDEVFEDEQAPPTDNRGGRGAADPPDERRVSSDVPRPQRKPRGHAEDGERAEGGKRGEHPVQQRQDERHEGAPPLLLLQVPAHEEREDDRKGNKTNAPPTRTNRRNSFLRTQRQRRLVDSRTRLFLAKINYVS